MISGLKYASQTWDPCLKKHIKKVEKIQNKALHFVFNITGAVSFTKVF